MRNDDHQVPSPEARVPRSRSWDSGLSEHFGDYRVLTPEFRLPGLRVASTCEWGVGTRRDSRLPSSGCQDSGLPAPGTRDSVNILEIIESQLPTPDSRVPATRRPGSRNSGVGSQESRLGDLQNVHLSEIKKYEHIGDHRVVTPDSRVPAAGTPGCRHPGVGSWELGLKIQIGNEHIGDHRVVTSDSRLPSAGCRDSGLPAPGSRELGVGTQNPNWK
ncbi:hypothetical protein F4604DRAFT_1681895 [Suillus subluteus]|nr:hypothetical protein F4604DRAFT_1681895 [Suillus subluteus]